MSEKKSVEVKFNNETLVVEGYFWPYHPGDRLNPPSPAEFNITNILVDGEKTDDFDDDILDIELLCIDEIENERFC